MKQKTKILLTLLFLLYSGSAWSQLSPGKRAFFLELGGSGGLASLNYEHSLKSWEKVNLRFRTGFSVAPIDKNNGAVIILPFMAHVLAGGPKHAFDGGAGITYSFTTKGNMFFRSPVCAGYRYSGNRWFFRVAYTPIVSWWFDRQWEHWAGITFGFYFGGVAQ